MKSNKRLKKAVLQAVDEQIEGNDPPYVAMTYGRLQSCGVDAIESRRMIGHCLSLIMFDMLKNGNSFDSVRYESMLGLLPDEESIYGI